MMVTWDTVPVFKGGARWAGRQYKRAAGAQRTRTRAPGGRTNGFRPSNIRQVGLLSAKRFAGITIID
jgi:hypothetical protein